MHASRYSRALLPGAVRAPALALAFCLLAGSLSAQADAERRRPVSPADIQQRMLAGLRERFGVASDDEWTVISERITKLVELRRTTGTGLGGFMFAGRGGDGGRGGDSGRSNGARGRSGGSTDVAALQAAIVDKLPDAEIKARLDRVRELRKENETKLAKAQEDLRAVLSVRQEAIAVLAGLLP